MSAHGEIVPPESVDECIQVSQEVPRDLDALSTDISGLLKDGILPDFKLKCRDQIFQVHRNILSARSEVFRAMFRSWTEECKTGSADIKDLEAPVLEFLLKFLYSAKLDGMSEGIAPKLYEAADKYAVPTLFAACSYWLVRNLTVDNCINYLHIADSHSDSKLKAAVVSFIHAHPGVFSSPAWLAFSKEHLTLAHEVLQTYVASSLQ